MLYLNDDDVKAVGFKWNNTIDVIEKTVETLSENDYAQPIKPYLKYGDAKNRIIAMPAFVGGSTNKAGIKWIASFPDNIYHGIPRANSTVILNNKDTGVVESVLNTALISIVRTASVSGFMIKQYDKVRPIKNANVGIIGFGPIGQNHFKMCNAILGDKVANYYLYDKRPVIDLKKVQSISKSNVILASSWKEVYDNSDIFITCTVADEPYVEGKPKKGALILHVSLRDFKPETFDIYKDGIIVDDWDEVCREKTVIDTWNKIYGLKKEDTYSIIDVLKNNIIAKFSADANIMFNPMGMAVFDIAIGTYYYKGALSTGKGTVLK
jgi:2,3-diaminopropionate biosynthesis protein SbnB